MTTLAWVGCVADTPEVAAVFGDDIAFRRDYYDVDFAGLPLLGFMLRHIGAGSRSAEMGRIRSARPSVAAGSGGSAVLIGSPSRLLRSPVLAGRRCSLAVGWRYSSGRRSQRQADADSGRGAELLEAAVVAVARPA